MNTLSKSDICNNTNDNLLKYNEQITDLVIHNKKVFLLNRNDSTKEHEKRVLFNSFDIKPNLNNTLITLKYSNNKPCYIEDNNGYTITQVRCLVRNLIESSNIIGVIVNTRDILDRFGEYTLFWELESVIDQSNTKLFIEYDYINLNKCNKINKDISIRLDESREVNDLEDILKSKKFPGMLKLYKQLAIEFIIKYKSIQSLLDSVDYLVIEDN